MSKGSSNKNNRGVIKELMEALESAEKEYKLLSVNQGTVDRITKEPRLFETFQAVPGSLLETMPENNSNRLYKGDNLDVMLSMREKGEKLSLVYIDPPFFTKADKDAVVEIDGEKTKTKAYKDSWDNMKEYLEMLALRLMVLKDILEDDGLIFVHVDWHAVHHIRLLLDEVFGPERFVNEIIWQYKSGGSTKTRFARKHDNILLYSKTNKYKFNLQMEKSYNRGLKPYRFKGVEEFQDEIGWYTVVNMKDVWTLDMVGRTSGERTGYATQKPEKLMERIILAGSDPGDKVGDFFCGSGSFGVTAAKLGREFVMCDMGDLAIDITKERLIKENISFEYLSF